MTRKTLFAAALLAVAGSSAFAGGEFDPTRDYQLPVTQSTLTRAEVKADVARARASGEQIRSDRDAHLIVQNVAGSTLTRAQVREETRTALRSQQRGRSTFSGS